MKKFVVHDRVRWSDCDPLGIIHYSTYLRFFEVAEFEMFRACDLPFEVLRKAGGVWLPRKSIACEFHSPAQMDEAVVIEAWFPKVGTTSLTMQFEVYREGDHTHRATGILTAVCVHKDTMAKYPIPADVREKIGPYVT